jgi:hypothetical protein
MGQETRVTTPGNVGFIPVWVGAEILSRLENGKSGDYASRSLIFRRLYVMYNCTFMSRAFWEPLPDFLGE